jgi:hypothetical protein
MYVPIRRLALRYVLSVFLLPPTLLLAGSRNGVAWGEVAERIRRRDQVRARRPARRSGE